MTSEFVDERMSDIDALVWAVEREPRYRTTIAALARFDEPIDEAALRHRAERASRIIPRLRQRVVNDPLGIAAPRWSIDPDFRLAFHLRRVRLRGASESQLMTVVRDLIVQPFDRSRPLWEFTVIDSMPNGGSGLLLKSHHSVSDGVGGVQMMLELFDLDVTPDSARNQLPPEPAAAGGSPSIGDPLRHETRRAIRAAVRGLDAAITPRSADEIAARARRLGASLGSAFRMFRPGAEPTPVSASRSAGLDLSSFSVALADLRAAGGRVDGTINDAFVSAVSLGVTDHHRHGSTAGPLRIGVPINTRGDDRAGNHGAGNHWAPGRIEVLVDADTDPDQVAQQVQAKMRRLRDEPAHDLLLPLAAGVRRLPSVATAAIASSLSSGLDVAASNVPGSPIPLHLCGQAVSALTPFGPLSGCAINVTLLSHAGIAHIGIASDPAAIPDAARLRLDIEAAFGSVIKGS